MLDVNFILLITVLKFHLDSKNTTFLKWPKHALYILIAGQTNKICDVDDYGGGWSFGGGIQNK